MAKEKLKLEHVEDALRRTAGIVSTAAHMLEAAYGSCTPATIRNYIKRYPRLKAAVDEAIELNLDLAESKLLHGIGEGNMTAIIYYLKTKGKNRGYVERVEATGEGGGPIIFKVSTTDAKL